MTEATPINQAKPRLWLLSSASQAMLSQIVRRTVRFFFLFMAARKLGPETFGTLALLLAILETLSLMTGEGLTDYVAREAAKSPVITRSLFERVSIIRFMLAGLLAPLAIAVLRALHYPVEVQASAGLLLLILFVRGPIAAAQGLFRAANRMSFLVWLEVVQGLVLLACGSYVLTHAATLRSVILLELSAATAAAILATLLARKFWRPLEDSPVTWRTIWRAAATFNAFPLITNIYDRIDIVLLSVIAGNAAAGLYALPYRVLATLQIIPFGLMAAVLPVLAARAQSSDDRQICLKMATLLGVLSMFPALILTLLAKPLVHLVLGDSYAPSANILRLLAWAAIPMFINHGLNTFLLARDRERIFIWTSSVCAVANIVLNVVLIPRYSYYAAAAVTIATELLLLLQNLAIIRRKFAFVALPNSLWMPAAALLLIVAVAQSFDGRFSPFIVTVTSCCVFIVALYFNGALKEIADSVSVNATNA